MKKIILAVISVIMLITSCDVYDKGYIPFVDFPIINLENTSSHTICIESYYTDNATKQETLWQRQEILPAQSAAIMDWTFPVRILIYKDNSQIYEYTGNNNHLIETSLNDCNIDIVSMEYVFDETKYVYDNIPFDKYDFSRIGVISESDALCGRSYNLTYKE